MGIGNQSFTHVAAVSDGIVARVKTPPTLVARAATTANIADLTAASVAQDGVTLVAGDLLLVKNQSDPEENGYYGVGTVGNAVAPLTRVWPLEDGVEGINGTEFAIESGTANGGKRFYLTNAGAIVIGTTELTFSQVADTASDLVSLQAVNATLVAGTATIATGITVAADSEVVPVIIGALSGTTNFGGVGELKASRVAGAPGVGTVVIQAYGDDGAIDADAAGAIRVLIFTPIA